MKFGKITIENFLTVGAATLDLKDRGLVLIQGDNRDDTSADSNGAGKSSLADALCWCLFGTTARGESGDAVVNLTAGKDCSVAVAVEDDGDRYVIERYRKGKVFKNALRLLKIDPVTFLATDLSKGTDKLTQIEVEKVLGCSYDVFRASVYAGQNSMPDLPGMTDKNLKLVVEEAAGTTILDAAYGKARSVLSGRNAFLSLAGLECSNNASAVGDLRRQIVDLEDNRRIWTTAQAAKIKERRDGITEDTAEAKRLAGEIAAYDKAIIESAIKECDDAIASVSVAQLEERNRAAVVNDAALKAMSSRSKLESLKKQHDKAKTDVASADHKVGCPCDECGRPITATEVEPAKAAATKRANEIAASYNEERKRLEAANAAHKSVTDALEAFRATMTDVSATSAQRASLLAKLKALTALERGRDGHIDHAKSLLREASDLQKQVNPYAELILKTQIRLNDAKNKVEPLRETYIEAEKQQKIAEIAVKVLSPTGVRGQVLDEVTPFLNDQTAKYLSTLSDGNIRATWTTLVKTKKGELKEQFAIEIEHDKGGNSFGLISGGEQRKVQIACALALQDLVATRAAKQISLFIGDEVDNALDPAGLERLVQVLEEKARERGSVFIISHSDISDWVAQIITVVKEGGTSRIEETIA